MTASSTKDRPVAAWMEVLDQIEGAVGPRLAHTEEPAPSPEPTAVSRTPLHVLDERLARIQARLDRAEGDARETDEVLRVEAEAFQRWTETAATARRRLADLAATVSDASRKR